MESRGSKKKRDTERSPFSRLSDDLLVEIFSRVPFKSTCCCKCVSTRWRDVITHPDHRKKLPRSTLAGFFYKTYNENSKRSHHYQSITGSWFPRVDPSLPFLPVGEGGGVYLLDSCNGLLLCRRLKHKHPGSEMLDYVVCNPATQKWVAVPTTKWSNKVLDARLGFDPAVSSHFHVFEMVHGRVWGANKKGDNICIKGVGIYSSKARGWTHKNAWDQPISIHNITGSAFFSGVMYLSLFDHLVVAAIDVEGNCRAIPIPTPRDSDAGFDVYVSRGQLYLANYGDSQLSVWVLGDSSSEVWTLKHTVSLLQLLGKEYYSSGRSYEVIIHPEHEEMFVVRDKYYSDGRTVTTVMSYEMDFREPRFICHLRRGCFGRYLQYVPLFSELLADGH